MLKEYKNGVKYSYPTTQGAPGQALDTEGNWIFHEYLITSKSITFAFDVSTPIAIYKVNKNALIAACIIAVVTPFDADINLTIGDSNNPESIVSSGCVNLLQREQFLFMPNKFYVQDTQLQLNIEGRANIGNGLIYFVEI